MTRRLLLVLSCCLLAPPAFAVEPVNTDRQGVAIGGYDPVAYFTMGEAVEGSAGISHEWRGAVWRFTSKAHRDLFVAEPEKYAPRFGGYCAWAVAKGKTAGIDPEAWSIVDGKLYLNYNRKIQRKWEKDAAANITKAEANWPRLAGEP